MQNKLKDTFKTNIWRLFILFDQQMSNKLQMIAICGRFGS